MLRRKIIPWGSKWRSKWSLTPAKVAEEESTSACANSTSAGQEKKVEVRLRRDIGVFGCVAMVAGGTIGSGIFISPTGVVAGSGSVGLSLLSWVICGAIALMGGLCFAELGTMQPESGAEYVYILSALGPIPAFLFAWIANVLINPVQIAIISMVCAQYLISMSETDDCGMSPATLTKLLTVAILLLLCAINCYSVRLVNRLNVFFTATKVLALVCIVGGGIIKIATGGVGPLASGFEGTESNAGLIVIGLYNGLWAYDGWKQANLVTEEIIDPAKNLPRGMVIGVSLVTGLYIMTNVSYFAVMSPQEMLMSRAVAVTWAESVLPSVSFLIPAIVAISTFGAALSALLAVSRLNFVASRNGHTLSVLSMVNIKSCTPMPTVMCTTLIAVISTFLFDINGLIEYFSFTTWTFYGLAFLSLIVMRRTKKHLHRPYKVPIVIPVVMVLLSAFLVLMPIIQSPQVEFVWAALLMLSGLLLYIPLVKLKYSLPYMSHVTKYLQMALFVVPSSASFD